MPPDPTALNLAPSAVDMHATDLATLAPTTCSSKCPSKDLPASVSILISSAAQASPPIIGDVLFELAAPMVDDKALGVAAGSDTAPMAAVCLPLGPDHNIGGEELEETREAPVSMEDKLQITPTPAEVSPTFVIVGKVMETGTTSDVYVPDTPEITLVSIPPRSMGCTDGAGASMASNNTDGDGIQPVIYNSDCVDLAIVTVPSDMTLAAASTVASMLNTGLVVAVTSPNGSSNSLEPPSCIFINLISWSPQFNWPPMSLYGHCLNSSDTQEFVEMLVELLVWKNGEVSRCLLSPWDPGNRALVFKCLDMSSTEHIDGTVKLMGMLVRWQFLRADEFMESKNFALQYIVEPMGSQLPGIPCFILPHAEPPDNYHQCVWTLYSKSVHVFRYRLLTTWICDLIIAMDSLWTTLRNANQQKLCYRLLTRVLGNFAIPRVNYTMVNRYTPCYAWMLLSASILQAGTSSYFKGNPCPCCFELLPWKFAWTLVLEFSTVSCSGNYPAGLTFSCKSCAYAREFHQNSSSDQTSHLFLTQVITVVHIITYQLLLFVKTHGFSMRSTTCASLELSVGKQIPIIEGPWECVIFLQPKPPWSLLAPTISIAVTESLHSIGVLLEFKQFGLFASHGSRTYGCLDFERKLMGHQFYRLLGLLCSCNQIVTENATYFDHQYFEWQIPWYICDKEFLEAFLLTAHNPSKALHFSWDRGACLASPGRQDNLGRVDDGSYCPHIDIRCINTYTFWEVTSTIGVLVIKNVYVWSTLVLQYLEAGNSLAVATLLLSNHQSEVWVLYIPVNYMVQCGHKLMTSEIARSEDDSLTCTQRVFISWDPGGLNHVLAPAWIITQLQFLHRAWDPGGMQHRLEGKPNLKKGGLSTTYLDGLACGPPPWAAACSGTGCRGGTQTYIPIERPQRDGGLERRNGRPRPVWRG